MGSTYEKMGRINFGGFPMIVTSTVPLPELISMANLKKHAPIRDRLRAVIYALQNDTAEEIALRLDRPISWVQGWVYRYRDFGIEGLEDLPRSGKPPKLAPHELTQFIARVLEGPQKSDEVFAFVGRDFKNILLDESWKGILFNSTTAHPPSSLYYNRIGIV